MICAPCLAARSAAARVFFRLAAGSAEQAVWIRPIETLACVEMAGIWQEILAEQHAEVGWELLCFAGVTPGSFYDLGAAVRRNDRRGRQRLAEELADEFTQRFIGWAITGMVDIVLQII